MSESEFQCYQAALRRDNRQAAAQSDAVPSNQTLDFLMEYLAIGSTYMDNAKVCCSLNARLLSAHVLVARLRTPPLSKFNHSSYQKGTSPFCFLSFSKQRPAVALPRGNDSAPLDSLLKCISGG